MKSKFLRVVFWLLFPRKIRKAVRAACEKVRDDAAWIHLPGATLGWCGERDQANILAANSLPRVARSKIHLACELFYHAYLRR